MGGNLLAGLVLGMLAWPVLAADLNVPPAGFAALFNGRDLSGWWGADTQPPAKLAELATRKHESLADIRQHWTVKDGVLINDGHGLYLTTEKNYGDFELLVEYRTVPRADSGIYLRGMPQVQIWDSTEEAKFKIGADKGSGGLWNNSPGAPGKDPLVLADKPFGEWNKFRIIMVGERVTVWLNDKLVVDHARMENLWDRNGTVPRTGPIQLQTHGGEIQWRHIFIREIQADEANKILRAKAGEGFQAIFNGRDFSGWTGDTGSYEVRDGAIVCRPGKGGNLYTEQQYGDFIVQLDIRIPEAGNNGLAIRYPGQGNPSESGMCEIQVLDSDHEKYAGRIDPRQVHGSAYGMVAAHRGYLRPAGEWNHHLVTVKGSTIQVEVNGTRILNADLSQVTEFMPKHMHPGKDRTRGHFGFAGHNDPVAFRNIEIRKID
jgi:hypothetical protein